MIDDSMTPAPAPPAPRPAALTPGQRTHLDRLAERERDECTARALCALLAQMDLAEALVAKWEARAEAAARSIVEQMAAADAALDLMARRGA